MQGPIVPTKSATHATDTVTTTTTTTTTTESASTTTITSYAKVKAKTDEEEDFISLGDDGQDNKSKFPKSFSVCVPKSAYVYTNHATLTVRA